MNADLRRPETIRLGGRVRLRGLALIGALALAGAACPPHAQASAPGAQPPPAATKTTTVATTTVKTAPVHKRRRTRRISRPAAPAAVTTTTETAVSQTPDGKTTETKTESRTVVMERKAGDIVTQPARDVGISKLKIPPVLVKARDAPYDLTGLNTCQQLADAVAELTAVTGPDFTPGEAWRENRAGKLAEAGGRAVVNSLIPYRGLVREVTGAAPQQRRLDDAVSAGFARRGFLRGLHDGRRCKNAFAADVAGQNRAIR